MGLHFREFCENSAVDSPKSQILAQLRFMRKGYADVQARYLELTSRQIYASRYFYIPRHDAQARLNRGLDGLVYHLRST